MCVLLFVFIYYCRLGELFNGCNGKVCFCGHLTNCKVYIVMFFHCRDVGVGLFCLLLLSLSLHCVSLVSPLQ